MCMKSDGPNMFICGGANATISQCGRGEREEGRYSFLIPFLTPSLNIET